MKSTILLTDPFTRRKITWRGLFMSWGQTSVINFFSPGEEVVCDIPHTAGDLFDTARYPWGCQEKLKGRLSEFFDSLASCSYAGWGFNQDDYGTSVEMPGEPPPPPVWQRMPPETAQLIDPVELKTKPFFRKRPSELFSVNETAARTYAQQHLYELLGNAFPARTYGMAANAGPLGDPVDMQNSCKANGWPRTTGEWRHSDLKDVAFLYTYPVFRHFVTTGVLE
jgi:hypothetical protein